MKLRDYLKANVHRRFAARDWDCSKFVLGWIATFAPSAAKAAVRRIVAAGYNEVSVGDDAGIRRVRERMGIFSAEDFAQLFLRTQPEQVEQPIRPRPGDIVIRDGDVACGILDEDYQVVYLAPVRGYEKLAPMPGDAFLRVKEE